ncbi:MAG TPA: MFS transporter [Alphaproteobacteria bacterium]|nr:MFS transporter [Alphaproteobacteria bacterium]
MNDESLALSAAPAQGASLKGKLGWVAYDMAGGPYFNIVKIFVFAPYFARAIIGDAVKGQELWAYIEGASGLTIALSSAIIGSMADAYGPRKPIMAILSPPVVLLLLLLWFAAPGAPALPVAIALVLIAVSSELSFLCHGSLLTRVAPPERVGFLSGLGFSANYLGTLIIFISWLALFGMAKTPALGLDRASAEDVRIICPMAGVWFALLALPFFLFTPDDMRKGPSLAAAFPAGLRQLRATLGHARKYANIMRYLLSRMLYFDGLVATFTFIGIYATGTFGWSPADVGLFGLIIFSVIVFAAFIGGRLDDLFGSKPTILASVLAVALSVVLALSIGRHSLLFFITLDDAANARPLPLVGKLLASIGFKHLTEQAFILCGTLGGIFMGPALASSRTLLARIAPESMMAEFFGLFTLSGKATSFLAPTAIALVTQITGSQRAGVAAVLVFLIVGAAGLVTVREERSDALAA